MFGFTASSPSDPEEFTTVIDILSESAEFSTFLRLLQKNGNIPYLNKRQNFTLLAPVNSAFVLDSSAENDFDVENYILDDLVLRTSEIGGGVTIIQHKVKFPLSIQRLHNGEIKVNEARIVEADLVPTFQRAIVHAISDLLPNAPKIVTLLEDLDSSRHGVHLFNSLANGFSGFETLVANNTLLVPLDIDFYKEFNHIEINYLLDAFDNLPLVESSIARDWNGDRERFLKSIICHEIVGGVDAENKDVFNLVGQKVNFTSHQQGHYLSVNNSSPSTLTNLIFDRGVAHCFTEIPFLRSIVSFNTEKYLHGMNSTDFVRELHFRNLQHLIKDESISKKMTIFIPEMALDEKFGFTKSSLLYHFVEDQLWLEDQFISSDGETPPMRMFESAFCSSNKKLGGNCQRLKIQKVKGSYIINDKYKVLHAKPYEIGETLIYTISEDLKLPGDFLSALNPFYHCSKSLMFLKENNLLKLPANKRGYTVLLPCFESWTFFDLNYEYLRNNATAANLIMSNLILDGLVYSDAQNVTVETQNFSGEKVTISIDASGDGEEETALRLSTVDEDIFLERTLDSFFDQGVIHPLKSPYFPRAVNITMGDLIETTEATEFSKFLEKFQDLASIVNDNKPYSLLIPTAASLNMEHIDINSTELHDFLKLHLVQGNYTKNLLHCVGRINTTLGEQLLSRQSSPGTCSLSLDNSADHEVRILRKGCSSFGNESCVFLIDRPISLLWLNREKNRLHLPGVAIGVGVVVGIFSVVAVFFCLLVVLMGKSHNKKSGRTEFSSEQQHEESESAPLLRTHDEPRQAPVAQNKKRFAGAYSINARVSPIDVASTPK